MDDRKDFTGVDSPGVCQGPLRVAPHSGHSHAACLRLWPSCTTTTTVRRSARRPKARMVVSLARLIAVCMLGCGCTWPSAKSEQTTGVRHDCVRLADTGSQSGGLQHGAGPGCGGAAPNGSNVHRALALARVLAQPAMTRLLDMLHEVNEGAFSAVCPASTDHSISASLLCPPGLHGQFWNTARNVASSARTQHSQRVEPALTLDDVID